MKDKLSVYAFENYPFGAVPGSWVPSLGIGYRWSIVINHFWVILSLSEWGFPLTVHAEV